MAAMCSFCRHLFDGKEGDPCPRCGGKETLPLPEPPASEIHIVFAGPGSTAFEVHAEGHVTAGQLVVVGQYLLDEGRFVWNSNRQRNAEAKQKGEPRIVVPGVGFSKFSEFLPHPPVRGAK